MNGRLGFGKVVGEDLTSSEALMLLIGLILGLKISI
jgi:hypothetical protein